MAAAAPLIGLIAGGLFGSGCAGAQRPSAPVDTMSPGWEQKVDVHWQVVQEPGGTRRIKGYVDNHSPGRYRVRILVKSLDASGAVVARRVQLMFGEVPPFERDYFEIGALPAAERYEVGVYSLEKVPALEG